MLQSEIRLIRCRRGYDKACNSLMYPDFKHMLRRLPPDAAAATEKNTIMAEGLKDKTVFSKLTAAELRARVEALTGDKTVVYLGGVPQLSTDEVSSIPVVDCTHSLLV